MGCDGEPGEVMESHREVMESHQEVMESHEDVMESHKEVMEIHEDDGEPRNCETLFTEAFLRMLAMPRELRFPDHMEPAPAPRCAGKL